MSEIKEGPDDGCHNCENRGTVPACEFRQCRSDKSRWSPDVMRRLIHHVDNRPKLEWCEHGVREYDKGAVTEWLTELEAIVAELQERYRRD